MTEQEVSHIEIVVKEDEEILQLESDKNIFLKKIIDIEGWKKDLGKIKWPLLVFILIVFGYIAEKTFLVGLLGLRFSTPIQFVTYQKYSHQNPNFSFAYPKGFSFDGDEKRKYGNDYLAGFYLNDDQRTGCDVRLSVVGINFSKSENEINVAMEKELSSTVKGISDYSGKKIAFDGKPAMSVEFSLIDPLGNVLHINQLMTTNEGENYLIACGSGQGQYKFFQNDFDDFMKSFRWKK